METTAGSTSTESFAAKLANITHASRARLAASFIEDTIQRFRLQAMDAADRGRCDVRMESPDVPSGLDNSTDRQALQMTIKEKLEALGLTDSNVTSTSCTYGLYPVISRLEIRCAWTKL